MDKNLQIETTRDLEMMTLGMTVMAKAIHWAEKEEGVILGKLPWSDVESIIAELLESYMEEVSGDGQNTPN